jgi:hypothetical protein
MSCNCTHIECFDVKYNPCSEGAQVNLTADESGNWIGNIEFNGMWSGFEFGVVDGEKIVIPTLLLNESYNHELKLYNTAGALVNDTCYYIKARAMGNNNIYPVIPVSGEMMVIKLTISEAGNSFTDTRLAGKNVAYIVTDDQSYTSTKWNKATNSDTLTSKLDGDGNAWLNFYEGQIVIVNFLKS